MIDFMLPRRHYVYKCKQFLHYTIYSFNLRPGNPPDSCSISDSKFLTTRADADTSAIRDGHGTDTGTESGCLFVCFFLYLFVCLFIHLFVCFSYHRFLFMFSALSSLRALLGPGYLPGYKDRPKAVKVWHYAVLILKFFLFCFVKLAVN